MRRILLVLVACWALCVSLTDARLVAAPLDGVAYWRPASAGPAPVLVFSHGYRGCPTQSTFLMHALAAAGYLVLAPHHADAVCGGDFADAQVVFTSPELWSAATYADRAEDIRRVLDALAASRVPIRWDQVGLVGHSLGGYTVLGVAGGWPGWTDGRIRAVLALSPYCEPFVIHGSLSTVGVPVMYQGGTRDLGITPTIARAGGCFDQQAPPASFVEFRGAGHLAWTDLLTEHHDLVVHYSLAFLDQHVRGLPTSPAQRLAGVSDLRVK